MLSIHSAQPTSPDSGMFLLLRLIFLLPPKLFLRNRLFPSLHTQAWIREKLLWMGKYQSTLSLWPCFLSEESFSYTITMASQGTSDLNALISIGDTWELAVISDLGVLHLSHQGIINVRPEIKFQGISCCKSLLKQERLGSLRSCVWRNKRLQEAR
jgi:hypothetical protein